MSLEAEEPQYYILKLKAHKMLVMIIILFIRMV